MFQKRIGIRQKQPHPLLRNVTVFTKFLCFYAAKIVRFSFKVFTVPKNVGTVNSFYIFKDFGMLRIDLNGFPNTIHICFMIFYGRGKMNCAHFTVAHVCSQKPKEKNVFKKP